MNTEKVCFANKKLVIFPRITVYIYIRTVSLESVQDFLIKLDMKPWMHLVGISIFSLNLVIVLLTKIMKKANKNWAYFQKIKYLKNQNFQKHFLVFQSNIFHRFFFFGDIQPILNTRNYEIFDNGVHNFGKPDEVIIQ